MERKGGKANTNREKDRKNQHWGSAAKGEFFPNHKKKYQKYQRNLPTNTGPKQNPKTHKNRKNAKSTKERTHHPAKHEKRKLTSKKALANTYLTETPIRKPGSP